MSNRAKESGTREESAAVEQAKHHGLAAGRHPEGGIHDNGDIWISDGHNDWDGEVKATQTLSVHAVLSKQTDKSQAHARPFVLWNRRIKTHPENRRRTSKGKIAALWWHDFLWLLARIRDLEMQVTDLLDQLNDKETA